MTFLTTIICKAKDLQRWKSRHRLFSWPSYGKWVEEIHQDKSQFVPFTDKPYERKDGDPKIFAYYLNQFHAIPENDEAHGKGFTEWTNVASAQPHFVGHYQPKIPYDLGFYNLLMPGVMERQVEIARAWSKGWCFNLTDDGFATWLTDILRWTKDNHAPNEQYVYINAWNEWGVGAILEPTLRYGYKSLNIVKQCLESSRENRTWRSNE